MHLADAFIQSDLHCIQVTVFYILSALYIIIYLPFNILTLMKRHNNETMSTDKQTDETLHS